MRVTFIVGLTILLLMGLFMVACQTGDGENKFFLSQDIDEPEKRILQDWQEQFGFPLHPDAYVHYGTFNGAVVLFIEGDAAIVTKMTIAGVTFFYNMDFQIYVWSENVFFTLSDAYQNNIVTQENIVTIGDTHKKRYQESIQGEYFILTISVEETI